MKTSVIKLASVVLLGFATLTHANSLSKTDIKYLPIKSQKISLKKGELFLVISAEQKQNVKPLLQSYFQKVFPPASKHGFKQLATLPIDKAFVSDYNPNNYISLYS